MPRGMRLWPEGVAFQFSRCRYTGAPTKSQAAVRQPSTGAVEEAVGLARSGSTVVDCE